MAKKNLENKLLAVVRVRGRARVRQSITETLNRLNLKRVNNLVLLYGSKSNIGMLNKCVDFVTFGEIDTTTLEKLLKEKGVEAKKELVDELENGKKNMKEVKVQLPMRMHPPKHGYEGIKVSYNAGGALGYRGAEINDLIKRMM
ncbi:MAG: uL30 family ribosomal protein [Candidatus Micrarchaeota archaeon]|nr:uL30 family ribosomal protein [Candidatus Micrarchaeota archaeon]MDE1804619.1 uL30 family ribosomal protein [Candidatus Micrarchaeota archaeon]MDE1846467.1 uL30 family ribosomal protein [Candidatus Micrarchaeota archaeon]